jgi:cystathionine gamma-synthase
MAAYLPLQGMNTLHLRIHQQNKSALKIARFLEVHPYIEKVYYPGLKSHHNHAIAHRQMRGYGGVLSFMLKGGNFDTVRKFVPRLRYAHAAANLSAVETIVGPPATTSHVENTCQERAAMGIPKSLIRYLVGIEDTEDLIANLERALGELGVAG